jgi:hypothetical protein
MALPGSLTQAFFQEVRVSTHANKTPEQANDGASWYAMVQLVHSHSAHVFVGYRSPSLVIPSYSARNRSFDLAVTSRQFDVKAGIVTDNEHWQSKTSAARQG